MEMCALAVADFKKAHFTFSFTDGDEILMRFEIFDLMTVLDSNFNEETRNKQQLRQLVFSLTPKRLPLFSHTSDCFLMCRLFHAKLFANIVL